MPHAPDAPPEKIILVATSNIHSQTPPPPGETSTTSSRLFPNGIRGFQPVFVVDSGTLNKWVVAKAIVIQYKKSGVGRGKNQIRCCVISLVRLLAVDNYCCAGSGTFMYIFSDTSRGYAGRKMGTWREGIYFLVRLLSAVVPLIELIYSREKCTTIPRRR